VLPKLSHSDPGHFLNVARRVLHSQTADLSMRSTPPLTEVLRRLVHETRADRYVRFASGWPAQF
jgi:hypothetical protein